MNELKNNVTFYFCSKDIILVSCFVLIVAHGKNNDRGENS